MEEKNFISKTIDQESGAGISVLDTNKTLMIDQYTEDASEYEPGLLEDAKNMNDVFTHFKPSVDVQFEDENGSIVSETLHFNEMRDFEAKGGSGNLVTNSEYLSKVKTEIDNSAKTRKQLERNKRLRDILKDPKSKSEFKEYLELLLSEIEENQ